MSLLGSSLGGGLAVLAALLSPRRVERMVLVNPAVYPQHLPLMYRMIRVPMLGELMMTVLSGERLVEGVAGLGYTVPEKMPEAVRQDFVRVLSSREARVQLMDVMRQLPGNPRERGDDMVRLSHVRQPVLVLWGAQERLLPVDAGRRLAGDLPDARLVEFEDLAHLPHDEAPERLGPVIGEFLSVRQRR